MAGAAASILASRAGTVVIGRDSLPCLMMRSFVKRLYVGGGCTRLRMHANTIAIGVVLFESQDLNATDNNVSMTHADGEILFLDPKRIMLPELVGSEHDTMIPAIRYVA